MHDKPMAGPDSTAVRVALWRAMHVQVDPPPHVLEDEIGLKLAGPGRRTGAAAPDMDPQCTRPLPRLHRGPCSLHRGPGRGTGRPRRQPVRHPRRRPRHLRPAPAGDRLPPQGVRGRPARSSGLEAAAPDRARLRRSGLAAVRAGRFRGGRRAGGKALAAAGFDASQPAVVASTGVSMYLTKEAIAATLRQVAALAPGSTLAMTFLLPLELATPRCARDLRWRRRGREQAGRLSSASSRRRRCWRWPAKPALKKPGTCRQPILPSATSRAGQTACARRTMRRNCWWRQLSEEAQEPAGLSELRNSESQYGPPVWCRAWFSLMNVHSQVATAAGRGSARWRVRKWAQLRSDLGALKLLDPGQVCFVTASS